MKMKKVNILYFVTVFFLTAVPLTAQQSSMGRLMGLSIEGNESVSEVVIRNSVNLIENQEVNADDLQNAIKNLWATGLFADVQVILERRVVQGVYLLIRVKEYSRLDRVVLSGNDKISESNIQKEIGFFRGQTISPDDVVKAKNRLKSFYAEKGYTLAEIETVADSAQVEDRVVLYLNINEGSKVKIREIQFRGNTIFSDRKLRRQLKDTKAARWWGGGGFDREEYQEDKKNLIDFYNNEGYRDAQVIRDSIYYDDERRSMYIDLWVYEGQKYYFGNITWEGNALFEASELNRLLTFEPGEGFSQEKFAESMQEKVGGAYYDRGYIFNRIIPTEKLRDGNIVDIHMNVMEGNPVRIRKIHITGNTTTKEKVIRRQLRIMPGDIFSKELLMRSARDLMMLNYFTNVVPDIKDFGAEEEMDLSFEVEEKSTQTANMSIGWSELDRLIGSIGLGMTNLFGSGQQLSLDWNFGRFYRSFSLSFSEPWFMNTPTLVGVSVRDTKRDAYYIGYSQKSRGFSLRLGRRFRWPDTFFRGDWIYAFDETELGDFAEWMTQQTRYRWDLQDWPLTTSSITQILSRNSLDNPEFPTLGSSVSLTTTLAGGPLGGNVGYHKHEFSAEFFMPAIGRKFIILARAQAGFMETIGEEEKLKPYDLFFMGGSGMSASIPLRGYDDPLAGGQYYFANAGYGGKAMLKTTFEFRFPVITNPTAFGLLFAEAGNTFQDLSSADPFNLRRSVGIGARIFMPMVGLLGFDYAYGFDNIDATGRKYGAWKPHFVFGKSF